MLVQSQWYCQKFHQQSECFSKNIQLKIIMNYNKIKRTNAICTVPENSCASSVSVVLPEIPPTKMRFGTRVPYFGALLLLLGCCGCGMCELVVTRFSDEAGEEEVVDPSVVPVLADD